MLLFIILFLIVLRTGLAAACNNQCWSSQPEGAMPYLAYVSAYPPTSTSQYQSPTINILQMRHPDPSAPPLHNGFASPPS